MNRVELEGYVGTATYSGPFCRISLATHWQGKTTWHAVKLPPSICENLNAQRGMHLYVCGFLTSESYVSKEGQKKTWYGIIATGVRIVRESRKTSTIENQKASLPESSVPTDDDIPF